MKGYFSNIKKHAVIVLTIFFTITPSTPIFSAELNSASYIIQEYDIGSGVEMNSNNYSITGSIDQVHTGIFSVSNLPLVPGTVTSCGKIIAAGTYTLDTDLIGISGTCFSVQANNVIIDGDGYSVTAGSANTSYAVTATSSSVAGSAYSTTTIQNIIFSGFAGGVNASGNSATSGNTNGGDGGNVVVSSSTLGSSITSGGSGFGSGVAGNDGLYTVISNSPAVSTTSTEQNTRRGSIRNLIEKFVPNINFQIPQFNTEQFSIVNTNTKDTSSFIDNVRDFFSTPIPTDIIDTYSTMSGIFAQLDINTMNDLISLRDKSIEIKNTKVTGLYTVYLMDAARPFMTYMGFDTDTYLYQTVGVNPGQKVTISLIPTIDIQNYEGEFNGEKVQFVNNTITLEMPSRAGTYTLSSAVTPMKLYFYVSDSENQYSVTDQKVSLFSIIKTSTWNLIVEIINRFKEIFDFLKPFFQFP